jgi:uncharacterized protein
VRTYVLYHANCADGFGAAVAARLRFGERADVAYVPVSYGQGLPEIEDGAEVFILDFSYPRAVLVALAARVSKLVVLDHHETARRELEGLPFATFDMSKSGARLAWEYFHKSGAPALILYIEDRDLWRWELEKSREFSAALWTYPQDFHTWLNWVYRPGDIDRLIQEGEGVLRLVKQNVERQCWAARVGIFKPVPQQVHMISIPDEGIPWTKASDMEEWWVPVVNATCHISEVGERLLDLYPEAPFVGIYLDKANGSRMWSLRSRKGFDCSPIAKAFGGGGHKQACGFTEVTA